MERGREREKESEKEKERERERERGEPLRTVQPCRLSILSRAQFLPMCLKPASIS